MLTHSWLVSVIPAIAAPATAIQASDQSSSSIRSGGSSPQAAIGLVDDPLHDGPDTSELKAVRPAYDHGVGQPWSLDGSRPTLVPANGGAVGGVYSQGARR